MEAFQTTESEGGMPTPTPDTFGVDLALLFAPLHKRAFGTAVGCAAALVVGLATVVYLVRAPDPGFDLGLLAQYFAGYTVSWAGALVGAAWAFVTGFVAGWFVAFCRNLVLAAWLFITRTRSELAATREFLDHI
jgi:hypothetical protein